MAALQQEIEQRLADAEPRVELLLAEVIGGGTLRVFIDHPDGVTLSLCERVSVLLSDLRDRYTLEVSSPGSERPLTKPDHFRAYVGRRVRVRGGGQPADAHGSRQCVGVPAGASPRRRSYTGELMGASESEITLAAEGGIVAIPYSDIRRCNLVEE